MHPHVTDAWLTRLPPAGWLAAGLVGAGVFGAATLWTPLLGDLALGVLALGVGGLGAVAAWRTQALGSLPLLIAPLALRGEVDAVPVVRIRARLGLGRAFSEARVRVWAVRDGAETELDTFVPAGTLVGPFTAIAQDPLRLGETSPLRVELSVTSAGRAWTATTTLPAGGASGRFAGIALVEGRVRLDARWAEPDRSDAGAAC